MMMDNFQRMILLCFLVISMTNCSNDDNQSTSQDIEVILHGQWKEIAPCNSCSLITFENNNTIRIDRENEPEDLKITYTIEKDAIRVERMWQIEDVKKTNLVNVLYHSNGSLELKQFYATDASSTTGFNDVTFNRVFDFQHTN